MLAAFLIFTRISTFHFEGDFYLGRFAELSFLMGTRPWSATDNKLCSSFTTLTRRLWWDSSQRDWRLVHRPWQLLHASSLKGHLLKCLPRPVCHQWTPVEYQDIDAGTVGDHSLYWRVCYFHTVSQVEFLMIHPKVPKLFENKSSQNNGLPMELNIQ